MTQPTAGHELSAQAHEAPAPALAPQEGRTVVRIGIALAALLFIGTSGLLYLRWATMREPTCIFIVEAPVALRGAEVTVDALFGRPQSWTVTIGRGERFAMPFYLEYGTYNVRVTLKDATVFESEIKLDQERPYQRLDLTRAGVPSGATVSGSSTTSPAARAGAGTGAAQTTGTTTMPTMPSLPSFSAPGMMPQHSPQGEGSGFSR